MMAHLPTVFQTDGEIDESAIRMNIATLRQNGIRAIYYPGSSGEFFNLSPAEYRRAIRVFLEEAGPDVLKIAGCGWPRLGETIEVAQWLEEAGADAMLVILPYFVPLSSAERVDCLREIARSAPSIGTIHYNTTYAPSVLCTGADYEALQDLTNFWGTKQGSVNEERWRELVRRTPAMHHLPLDDWLLPAMESGSGHGSFSLLTSFSPRFALRFFDLCDRGSYDLARTMDAEWKQFIDNVYMPLSRKGYSDIALDKAFVDCFGVLTAGPPRRPLRPVSPDDKEWALEQIGLRRYLQDAS
jgi:4-hydroxy-tetrahydrodipicolinate synthase